MKTNEELLVKNYCKFLKDYFKKDNMSTLEDFNLLKNKIYEIDSDDITITINGINHFLKIEIPKTQNKLEKEFILSRVYAKMFLEYGYLYKEDFHELYKHQWSSLKNVKEKVQIFDNDEVIQYVENYIFELFHPHNRN